MDHATLVALMKNTSPLHPQSFRRFLLGCIVSGYFCLASVAGAAINDWVEGSQDAADGATRDYYNRAARLEWQNYLGDWRDQQDIAQGNKPFASADIEDTNIARNINWQVTELVQLWVDGTYQNQGFFINAITGGGPVDFRSKEYSDSSQWPQLHITTQANTFTFTAVADTQLEPSTYRSMGDSEKLRLTTGGSNILLRFNLETLPQGTIIESATLQLFTYAQYNNSTMKTAVYRCSQGESLEAEKPRVGVANNYPNDEGIEAHPSVIFATSFEQASWEDQWSHADGQIETIHDDPTLLFQPLDGKALRALIPQGENSSMSVTYDFLDKVGSEPEEIYFRYYLRFADDWQQSVAGGKLPGISGTYGVAGWGGRKPDGTDGWSARGTYFLSIEGDNPLTGTHPIGSYCYYADQPGTYGDTWAWTKAYKGFLRKNQWYCIEQYIKMNTSGAHDGILLAWVDGVLAFEKTDIMFRTIDALKIERIWMNVYHGGKAVSPYDQHLYIDKVVIGRNYIGPMNTGNPQTPGSGSSVPQNLLLLLEE